MENIPFNCVETKKVCNDYLKTLLAKDTTQGVIEINCYEFKRFARKCLADKQLCEVTRSAISEYLKNEKRINLRNVLRFLYHAKKYLSTDVRAFLDIGLWTAGCFSTKSVTTVLDSSNPEQFFVVSSKGSYALCYTDAPFTTPLFEIIKDFAKHINYSHSEDDAYFIAHIFSALGESVTDLPDLTMSSFKHAANYFWEKGPKPVKQMSLLMSFFKYCSSYGINFLEDDGLDLNVFEKPGLARKLANGYEIVKYNRMDPVPAADQWALVYNPANDAGTTHNSSSVLYFDFTGIKNETFRSWVKMFVWVNQKSIKSKRTCALSQKRFLNYVHDIRVGKERSLFAKPGRALDKMVTIKEVDAYLGWINSQGLSGTTKATQIDHVRQLFNTLKAEGFEIAKGIWYVLYTKGAHTDNTAKAIPKADLEILVDALVRKTKDGIASTLYLAVFNLQIQTELRVGEILALEYDCIRETIKKGEYIILSPRKNPRKELEEIPITKYVKQEVDAIMGVTDELRKIAPQHLKKRLFLAPQMGITAVRAITVQNYREYLRDVCEEIGLPYYKPENVRDTHMTLALERKIEKGMSDIKLSVLTGHKTKEVLMDHYADLSLREMHEILHGTIIGNIDMETGEIIETGLDDASLVSDGCGYCSNTACNDLTLLACLVCKHFVTTPSRREYFEEQIKVLDEKIQNATLPHDKEDLMAIKRLHVAYLVAIDNHVKKGAMQ